MSTYTITGRVIRVLPTETRGQFTTRKIVVDVTDNPQYAAPATFEATQDKCNELNNFHPGKPCEIKFVVNGRDWTNPQGQLVNFTTLKILQISPVILEGNMSSSAKPGLPPPNPLPEDEFESDLPF